MHGVVGLAMGSLWRYELRCLSPLPLLVTILWNRQTCTAFCKSIICNQIRVLNVLSYNLEDEWIILLFHCVFRLQINWGLSIVLCTLVMPVSLFHFIKPFFDFVCSIGHHVYIYIYFWREPECAGSCNRSYWICFTILIPDKREHTSLGTPWKMQVFAKNLICYYNYLLACRSQSTFMLRSPISLWPWE